LLYGHTGSAAELGHVVIKKNGRTCGCGRQGCLETYVSATGIKRTVLELLGRENVYSDFRRISYDKLTAKDIYDLALEGDEIAIKAFDFTAEILGRELANAAAYFSPEAFILFGGLTNSGRLLLEPLIHYFNYYLFEPFRGSVKIIRSGLPEADAAVLGASALAWDEISENKVREVLN
jgi:glucokinase